MEGKEFFNSAPEEEMRAIARIELERAKIVEMAITNMESRGLGITEAINKAMLFYQYLPAVDTGLREEVSDLVIAHQRTYPREQPAVRANARADARHNQVLRSLGERD